MPLAAFPEPKFQLLALSRQAHNLALQLLVGVALLGEVDGQFSCSSIDAVQLLFESPLPLLLCEYSGVLLFEVSLRQL